VSFIAFGIEHKMSMRHIAVCGLAGSILFLHNILNEKRFSKEGTKLLNINSVLIFSACFVQNISQS
jgi:hypothetical protein